MVYRARLSIWGPWQRYIELSTRCCKRWHLYFAGLNRERGVAVRVLGKNLLEALEFELILGPSLSTNKLCVACFNRLDELRSISMEILFFLTSLCFLELCSSSRTDMARIVLCMYNVFCYVVRYLEPYLCVPLHLSTSFNLPVGFSGTPLLWAPPLFQM